MNFEFTTPFALDKREQIATQVVNKLSQYLPGLQVDCSYESGFNLPLTQVWLKKDYGEYLNQIIKYHNSRQLRFRFSLDNKLVTGLRFKDEIEYWSNDETTILLDTINKVILSCD